MYFRDHKSIADSSSTSYSAWGDMPSFCTHLAPPADTELFIGLLRSSEGEEVKNKMKF